MHGALHHMANARRNVAVAFKRDVSVVTAEQQWNRSKTVCVIVQNDQPIHSHAAKKRAHHNGLRANGASVQLHAERMEHKPEKLNALKSHRQGKFSNELITFQGQIDFHLKWMDYRFLENKKYLMKNNVCRKLAINQPLKRRVMLAKNARNGISEHGKRYVCIFEYK